MKCKDCGRELDENNFRIGRWGRLNVCNECMEKRREANRENRKKEQQAKISELRSMRLDEFAPIDLMKSLARRGYKGKLTHVRVVEIDITTV